MSETSEEHRPWLAMSDEHTTEQLGPRRCQALDEEGTEPQCSRPEGHDGWHTRWEGRKPLTWPCEGEDYYVCEECCWDGCLEIGQAICERCGADLDEQGSEGP